MSFVPTRTKSRLCDIAVLIAGAICVVVLSAGSAAAQDGDESAVMDDHSPQGALWRAAAIPGWGQFYNRQYYKIPIVWAGIGGLTASALAVNRQYLLYRHAFHYLVLREDGEPLFPQYEPDFEEVLRKNKIAREGAAQYADHFRRTRDNLRRNRDLLYIGVGLFYGLTILDAYVNAHLLDFDVGEDLTLAVRPAPTGMSVMLRVGR